ncbi:MAG TPA: hypothetical protein VGC89_09065 [Pyrinomonadaceae bacterium]
MTICEFCMRREPDGKCRLGLAVPKRMGCREFEPGVERFCSNPSDFVSSRQIVEMATYFGIKGMELKKVKLMTAREASNQSS